MKMESPLEVLSRAVSIVQSENKANSYSAPPMASSDSGIEDDLTTEYSERSPKRLGSMPIKSSPKRNDFSECSQRSPVRLLNAVKYLQKSSKDPESKPQLSPRKFESAECKRRSPKRLIASDEKLIKRVIDLDDKHIERLTDLNEKHMKTLDSDEKYVKRLTDSDEKHLKKIKLEEPEPDHHVSSYQRSLPIETSCSKSVSPQRDSEARLIAKPNVPIMNSINGRHIQVLPSYMQTYPPYPPLFILTDKPTQYSKLMETYDSIFAPKPPLIPLSLPPSYTKCNCGDKNCSIIKSPKYSAPAYREKSVESNEYGLPNVDEHFRKSLGEKYDILKCEQVNERPSSVDDHFAKALGQKWFNMEYGKCSKI